ncbi:hypothetical protein GLOIN_2v1881564 [Rhizophagus irregularis DAOM 181602=DAOM 197198]|nr:hypothetical protein GLOIN_2v1881564 [Rhizophagus irregularis DAOM 181602=DAOM 197198]
MNTVLEYDKEFDKVKSDYKKAITHYLIEIAGKFVTVENVKGMKMCEADLIKEENFEYLQFTTEPEAATIYGSTIGNSTVEKLRLPQRIQLDNCHDECSITVYICVEMVLEMISATFLSIFFTKYDETDIVMELLGTLKIDLPDRGSIDELVLSFGQMDKIIF